MTGCQWLTLVAMIWFPLSLWLALLVGPTLARRNPPRPPTNDDFYP